MLEFFNQIFKNLTPPQELRANLNNHIFKLHILNNECNHNYKTQKLLASPLCKLHKKIL